MDKKPMTKEAIGAFEVVTDDREIEIVVVSQKVKTHYRKEDVSGGKFLNLGHINGLEVYKTLNPNVFKLGDGKKLRKVTNIRSDNVLF